MNYWRASEKWETFLWIGSTFWECFKEHSIVGKKTRALSLCFIPVGKLCPGSEREREVTEGGRDWKLTYCSPFICMKLFTTFSCCSPFFAIHVPYCSIFLNSDFVSVSAFFRTHRWRLRQTLRTISYTWLQLLTVQIIKDWLEKSRCSEFICNDRKNNFYISFWKQWKTPKSARFEHKVQSSHWEVSWA